MASFNNFNPIPLIIALFFSLQFSITKALPVFVEELIHKDDTKDLNLVRLIECMLIIFAITFTCALLPYFFRKNANFLLGPSFAGGVFLGTSTSMNFMNDSIGGEYLPSFLILLGYFLTAFGEIISVKILRKKKKMMMSWEPPAIVEVEEGRNAAAAMMVVEEESVNARVAAVGVTVAIFFGLAINSFHEGIQIGQQRRTIYAWGRLLPISIKHALLAIALGIVALRMQLRRPFLTLVAYSFAFAISTPVGILIALGKDDDDLLDSILDDLLMGIFSGVSLYISVNHLVLAKGLKSEEPQRSYDTPFRNFWVVILVIGLRLFGAVISGWL